MRNAKTLFALFFLLIAALNSDASTLYRVRFGYFPDKIRAVFDFDNAFTYQAIESELKDKIILLFKDTEASPEIQNYVELNDLIIKYLEVEKIGSNLKITVPLSEPIEYNIFYLNDPPRLVIDFDRAFLNVISGGLISEGVEFLRIKKGTPQGNLLAAVLKVNLNKVEVEPALAHKYKPNILESFVSLLSPWKQKVLKERHFHLETVSNIAGENGALAGINGTFFADSGRPLGALIIDNELVSFPIYDRTSFFLDKNNNPYIDNVFITSYFKLPDGSRHKINNTNLIRGEENIILYTPAWGERTETILPGTEIVVVDSKIAEINSSNSRIPENGYVLSSSGPAAKTLSERIKIGDPIEVQLKIIPYSTSPDRIVHLISGGPRLIKNGIVYVSKYGEKFKADVAQKRAARTALGITKSGQLLMVTVQGPSPRKTDKNGIKASLGATLEDLSELMQSLGAEEAMNLDGGSSTAMVIRGKNVCGSERRISNALLIFPKD